MAKRSITETVAPAAEPVEVSDVKTHLRVTFDDDDTYFGTLIKVARRAIETQTQRALITRTLKLVLESFPASRVIELPFSPVQSVTSVKYYASGASSLSTLSSDNYRVDTNSTPGRVVLKEGQSWPAEWANGNAVEITYVSGHGDAKTDVPEDLRHAVLMLCGHYYENREDSSTGPTVQAVPRAVDALCMPWKIYKQ